MKLHSIVKVEKKEKFWWQSAFQYLLDEKILSRDELAYLFGQIKSIVNQEQEDYGNREVELDVGKIRVEIKKYLLPLGMRIDRLSNKVGKPNYKPNYEDGRELNLIYKEISNYDKLAAALKAKEGSIIIEIKR